MWTVPPCAAGPALSMAFKGAKVPDSKTSESSDPGSTAQGIADRQRLGGHRHRRLLGHALISPLTIHPHEPNAAQSGLPTPARDSVTPPHEPKSVREISTPGLQARPIANIKQSTPPPRPPDFLSLPSANHASCAPSRDTLPPNSERTPSPSWATPTPTSLRSTRSACWRCVYPSSLNKLTPITPPPPLFAVVILPHHQGRGNKKKRRWVALCAHARRR